jgi:hypothetical protein
MLKTTVKETDDQRDRIKTLGEERIKKICKGKEMKIKESGKKESKST